MGGIQTQASTPRDRAPGSWRAIETRYASGQSVSSFGRLRAGVCPPSISSGVMPRRPWRRGEGRGPGTADLLDRGERASARRATPLAATFMHPCFGLWPSPLQRLRRELGRNMLVEERDRVVVGVARFVLVSRVRPVVPRASLPERGSSARWVMPCSPRSSGLGTARATGPSAEVCHRDSGPQDRSRSSISHAWSSMCQAQGGSGIGPSTTTPPRPRGRCSRESPQRTRRDGRAARGRPARRRATSAGRPYSHSPRAQCR